eukprot:9082724-Pyramimonas_sp.AAC.1
MEPTTKKQRRIEIGYRTSFAGAAQIVAQLGDGRTTEAARHELRQELLRTLDVVTPVGSILQRSTLNLASGEVFVLDHVRPQALLYTLCAQSAHFAAFFKRCLQESNSGSGFLLYTDETTCGNQLRPDSRRKCQAMYFTHSAFPTWFRSRQDGWFVWAYVPCEIQGDLDGGLSTLFKLMLSDFFKSDHNFMDGIMLPCGNEWFPLKCGIFAVIQDEKAHKEIASLKGASGLRPCIRCKNIVRRTSAQDLGPYLRDADISGPDAFDEHTSASFWETVDIILAARDDSDLLRQSFVDLQQVAGLSYNAHSAIWDRSFRLIYDPINHNVEDWMHVFCASGGVGQYEIA